MGFFSRFMGGEKAKPAEVEAEEAAQAEAQEQEGVVVDEVSGEFSDEASAAREKMTPTERLQQDVQEGIHDLRPGFWDKEGPEPEGDELMEVLLEQELDATLDELLFDREMRTELRGQSDEVIQTAVERQLNDMIMMDQEKRRNRIGDEVLRRAASEVPNILSSRTELKKKLGRISEAKAAAEELAA